MTLPERVIIAAKTLVELRVYLGSTKRRWTPEELIVTAQQIKNKKKKKEEKMSRHTWQEFIEDEARDYGDDISDIVPWKVGKWYHGAYDPQETGPTRLWYAQLRDSDGTLDRNFRTQAHAMIYATEMVRFFGEKKS